MKAEEIKILLEKSFPGKAFELIENATPQGLAVSAEDLVEVMIFCIPITSFTSICFPVLRASIMAPKPELWR